MDIICGLFETFIGTSEILIEDTTGEEIQMSESLVNKLG